VTGSTTLVRSARMGDNGIRSFKESIDKMTESHVSRPLVELVLSATEGNEKALEAIYHRFKVPLFNLAYRYTGNEAAAEDILQEVFLTAFTRLADLKSAERFPGWIFRIAVNTCLSHVRSRKAERRSSVPLSEMDEVVSSPVARQPDATLRRTLEEAIHSLPERLRSVFLLHDVQGFKHEEIAAILGCRIGTSKSNLFKARSKLRNRLAEIRKYKE
jgi:RNA polymerase sigma-70 factor (ECF subfamily)